MTHFVIKGAVINEAPEHTGYRYYVMHPQNDAILAYCKTAEEANRVVSGLEDLGAELEGGESGPVVDEVKCICACGNEHMTAKN